MVHLLALNLTKNICSVGVLRALIIQDIARGFVCVCVCVCACGCACLRLYHYCTTQSTNAVLCELFKDELVYLWSVRQITPRRPVWRRSYCVICLLCRFPANGCILSAKRLDEPRSLLPALSITFIHLTCICTRAGGVYKKIDRCTDCCWVCLSDYVHEGGFLWWSGDSWGRSGDTWFARSPIHS